jgi:hypothetical protein
MTLVNKFFIVNDADHEGYRTGQIIASLPSDFYLAYMAGKDTPMPAAVISLTEMASTCEHCGNPRWELFASRENLKAYMRHFEGDDPKPSMLKIVPPNPKHH